MPRMHEWILEWMQWVTDWGYWGVIALMAMESSIIPVPSEIVVPPAAILATLPDAQMSFWGVVLAGTVAGFVPAYKASRMRPIVALNAK